jgi:hypothetical protein
MIALLVAIFLPPLIFTGCGTQIPSGHRGVKYFKFGEGTAMGRIYTEGFNWHFPWKIATSNAIIIALLLFRITSLRG